MWIYNNSTKCEYDVWITHVSKLINVLIVKVKGHASTDDVLSGRTTLENKLGNDSADALAVAAVVPVPLEQKRRNLRQANVAKQVQKMMVDILKARRTMQQTTEEVCTVSSSDAFFVFSEEPPDWCKLVRGDALSPSETSWPNASTQNRTINSEFQLWI